ncbi:MAG: Rrf2 family transcriptional regulator [Clostridia bacterium]|nr:Rrf2 family transcriptional regulator [Clostridia bacterium]
MITTKGRYALRIMIDLAQHETDAYIPLKDIAARQGISKKYLEVIVKDLVKGGLVSAASGKGGGYKLNRAPSQYSVGDILTATEGSLAIVACVAADAEECPRAESCHTLPMWREFDTMVHDFFERKKLTDLL